MGAKKGNKNGATHGMKYTYVYRKWSGMKIRCLYPSGSAYARYGGRGIAVCERWMKFENFFADMGHPPAVGYELDRIDNSKGYEPGNCRWVTRSQNCRNRTSNRHITAHGVTRTIAEWSELTGIDQSTLGWRIRHGWSGEQTVSLSEHPGNRWVRNSISGSPPMRIKACSVIGESGATAKQIAENLSLPGVTPTLKMALKAAEKRGDVVSTGDAPGVMSRTYFLRGAA